MNVGSSIVDRVQEQKRHREQRSNKLISMTKETRRIETTSRKYKSYKSILESAKPFYNDFGIYDI